MIKKIGVIVSALMLSGCAGMSMKPYMGQSIQHVVVDHGPATHQFSMGNGVEAFQWEVDHSQRDPVTEDETVKGRHSNDEHVKKTYVGGDSHTQKCFYTFFAKKDSVSNNWIITGFKKPSTLCLLE